jgi:NADPH:quinone reductase-like Zn-dependent oxidoreductase
MRGGKRVVAAFDGTACVLDPFCDVHFGLSAKLLAFGGRYVTCGVTGTGPSRMATAQDYGAALVSMIQKNVTVITNCLGRQDDLEFAIELCAAGRLRVVVDSILGEDKAADFCTRSFLSEARVGKVIMQYR